MSRLFQAARDNASDILAAVAASIYFLGFLGAIHAALDRLSYCSGLRLGSAGVPRAETGPRDLSVTVFEGLGTAAPAKPIHHRPGRGGGLAETARKPLQPRRTA